MTTDSSCIPESFERRGDFDLVITWSDGSQRLTSAVAMRDGCPCATCREKLRAKQQEEQAGRPKQLPVLLAGELTPLRIVRMVPVGNYAYNVAFSDGHDSGIYTFELLRQLGRPLNTSSAE